MPAPAKRSTAPPRSVLIARRWGALLVLVAVVAVVVLGIRVLVRPSPGDASGAAQPGTTSAPSSTAPSAQTSTTRPSTPASAPSTTTITATPTSATVPVVTSTAAAAALRAAVLARNKGVSGQVSVAVTDLDSGVVAAYGAAGHGFATASIVKVDILATLLLQRDGRLTASQRRLATAMIEHSDNNAASALWVQIGRAAGLNRANEEFGMEDTHGGRGSMWGTTTTTAADQLRLLRTVFTDDSELSAASRDAITDLMGDVEPDQDWGVSAADTRKGEKYMVKNGWLPRTATGLWVVNSIGSVSFHGHHLLIAVVSDGRRSMTTGIRVLESVAKDAAAAVTGR